jgi:hypothetical protein
MNDVKRVTANPGGAPKRVPGIPTCATDAPQEIGSLHELDAVELALGDLKPCIGMNGHQRDVVATPGERRTEVQSTVIRPALAGRVVDDEQDLERIRHDLMNSRIRVVFVDLDNRALTSSVIRRETLQQANMPVAFQFGYKF